VRAGNAGPAGQTLPRLGDVCLSLPLRRAATRMSRQSPSMRKALACARDVYWRPERPSYGTPVITGKAVNKRLRATSDSRADGPRRAGGRRSPATRGAIRAGRALTCGDVAKVPLSSENDLSRFSLIGGTFHAHVP